MWFTASHSQIHYIGFVEPHCVPRGLCPSAEYNLLQEAQPGHPGGTAPSLTFSSHILIHVSSSLSLVKINCVLVCLFPPPEWRLQTFMVFSAISASPSPQALKQFSSVTQLYPTLCNPMDRSTPGLPIHHPTPRFYSNSCPQSQ